MKPIYKILIAIGVVLVLGAGIYFIWWLFIDAPTAEVPPDGVLPPGNGGAPVTTTTPSGGEMLLPISRAISDRIIFDYWLVPETGEVYYLTPEGYIYVAKEGPDLELSHQIITALNHAEPSLDGRRLLVSFGNPSAPQWGIFDTVDSVWRPLPREVTNAGWGRSSSELVASVTSGNDTNLSFVDISKTPPVYTVLARNFLMADVMLGTLEGGDILIVERATARFEGRIWRLNPVTRAFTLALSPTLGRIVKVEKGDNVTYFSDTESFSIADGALQNPFSLFFRTLPDKCAAAASTSYCFIPRNLAANTVFPDDYLMRNFYSIDSLYAIAHPSRAIRALVLGDVSFDASRVRAHEKTVYFIDRYSSLLYKLDIE
jgi:hypothetical protein